jgi:hypothetical protein
LGADPSDLDSNFSMNALLPGAVVGERRAQSVFEWIVAFSNRKCGPLPSPSNKIAANFAPLIQLNEVF